MDVSAAVTCGCSACMSLAMVVGQSWSCAGAAVRAVAFDLSKVLVTCGPPGHKFPLPGSHLTKKATFSNV